MKKIQLLLVFSGFIYTGMAQQLSGHYKLRGVQDMAAGFEFKGDSFYFYCYYGVVDRFANGTYTINGNTVILSSSKQPGNDFNIVSKQATTGNTSIKVTDPNAYLAEYAICIIQEAEERQYIKANRNGVIEVAGAANAKLYLMHELYPDIPTLLKDTHEPPAQYEVKLNPSLQQLSFKGIDLTMKDDGTLTWLPNYFIAKAGVWFEKKD